MQQYLSTVKPCGSELETVHHLKNITDFLDSREKHICLLLAVCWTDWVVVMEC